MASDSGPELPRFDEALKVPLVTQVEVISTESLESERHMMKKMALYNTIYGLAFIFVGVVAIICPITFTFAIDYLIGGVLVFGGVIALGSFFMLCGSPGSILFLVLGILHLGIGIWLLMSPEAGVLYLTLVLCGWFVAQGVCKLAMAYSIRKVSSWPAVFSSGLLSIVLGAWILTLLPDSALWVLGVLFGVDLTVTGVAALVVAIMACAGKDVAGNGQPLLTDLESAEGNN